MLEANALISTDRASGRKLPLGINLTEPSYIAYMCAVAENPKRMSDLIEILEGCEIGQTINAEVLTDSVRLAKYVIRAFFQIYAAKGFGYCSGGMRQFKYSGKA